MSRLTGTVCTPEENTLASSSTSISCLTRGQSIGLALTAESGFISTIAVLGVFFLVARKYFLKVKLIQRPTDLYMLSLFTSDLIQALGAVLDIKWVHEGKVYTGSYCTAQGAIQQLGETGVALATLTIAIHTLIVVMWGKLKHQLIVAYIVVALIWLFVILFVSISISVHTRGSDYYETPTPYWCWIGDGQRYNAERIAGEYIWLWVTLLMAIFTYIPLFFWARGMISISPEHWWKIRFHSNRETEGVQIIDPRKKRRALGMIAYPLVYSVIVLPLSVVRWVTGFGSNIYHLPSEATFIVIFIYNLSGLLNALLFLLTRSELLLLGNTSSTKRKRLGQAPGIVFIESKSRPSGVTDTNSTLSESVPQQVPLPLEAVHGAEDGSWHLPSMEEGSE